MKKYKQLSEKERVLIDHLYNKENKNMNQISKIIGRNRSTIKREIERNSDRFGYDSTIAHKKYNIRSKNKYLFSVYKYQEFVDLFLKKFDKKFFGVLATYNWIKSKHPNIKCPCWREIFYWIKHKKWPITPSKRLRKYYVKGRKRKIGIFSKFNNKMVFPIWVRPKSVDLRLDFGHWEADLVIGLKQTGFENIVTLTERVTRMSFFSKIKSKNPMKCNSVLYKMIKENNLNVKSITIDNGSEFEKIGLLANWINANIYYCEPYASYQRGSNENINGLIRREYKKGTDFSLVSEEDVVKIQNSINNMPRKIFGWKSSLEIYNYYNKKIANNQIG